MNFQISAFNKNTKISERFTMAYLTSDNVQLKILTTKTVGNFRTCRQTSHISSRAVQKKKESK